LGLLATEIPVGPRAVPYSPIAYLVYVGPRALGPPMVGIGLGLLYTRSETTYVLL